MKKYISELLARLLENQVRTCISVLNNLREDLSGTRVMVNGITDQCRTQIRIRHLLLRQNFKRDLGLGLGFPKRSTLLQQFNASSPVLPFKTRLSTGIWPWQAATNSQSQIKTKNKTKKLIIGHLHPAQTFSSSLQTGQLWWMSSTATMRQSTGVRWI